MLFLPPNLRKMQNDYQKTKQLSSLSLLPPPRPQFSMRLSTKELRLQAHLRKQQLPRQQLDQHKVELLPRLCLRTKQLSLSCLTQEVYIVYLVLVHTMI